MKKAITLIVVCAGLAGCNKIHSEVDLTRNAPQITGPLPYVTTTPVDPALACIEQKRSKGQDLRIGIGEIVDGTGAKTFEDGNTPLLTQRPDMMFAVALKKTGVRALNRNSTRVAEWEMSQSMEQRLGEGRITEIDGQEFAFRPVEAGSMLGSTHFVTGALTEVNWNIYSDDKQSNVVGAFKGKSNYYISVAIDLMVTDTLTTEVVLARSYTKQIVGQEVSKGFFRFFEVDESGVFGPVELFDISSGAQQNEPVQRAVRWLVDIATYDIAATLTKTKSACDPALMPRPIMTLSAQNLPDGEQSKILGAPPITTVLPSSTTSVAPNAKTSTKSGI